MKNIWTVAKREYRLYFNSPAAYLVLFVVLLVVGFFFYLNMRFASENTGYVPGVEAILSPLVFVVVLATPAITTRLLAEEQRMGTIELLLTAPVRDWEVVVGKWLGAFLFMLTVIAITIIYPIILNQLITPGIDQGPLVSGYLGMILLTAALLAVGVAISSLFSNQIAVFITTLVVVIFLWWLVGIAAQVLGAAGPASELVSYLDIQAHYYNNFFVGIIDLRDITFYLSLTGLALFLGAVSVETRRWR